VQSLQQQSQQVAAGQAGMPPAPPSVDFQYTIDVLGRLNNVAEFEDVIVKTGSNGEVTRLRDVGRVELGAQTYIREVYKTLIEAAVLVLIVISVFLQDWRAMLVPATTVPVTIIGAFAAMWALGFTVNFSTLFAIVLSIGIVVDDAIVVVENASRNIERGMNGYDAAIQAMKELLGPIIGITLVLMSAFLPAAFLPGLTGRMYAQFALVIAATALLSAINAVTLKPTQSALWLRPAVPLERRNAFYRGFNAVYGRLERGCAGLIGRMVKRSGLMAIVALAIIAVAIWGLARVPTGFLPIEDQGYLLVAAQLPDGAALGRASTSFRASAPQLRVEVDRVKAQTLHVTLDQVFATLSTYLGSAYVTQLNKFGRVFQVYAQADAPFRLRPRDIENCGCATSKTT
jgi:multidrug efflux pump subunit AcrB